jgi:uncharacterized protein
VSSSRKSGGALLVDTGPLVALFDPSDRARGSCEAALAEAKSLRLVTSLAVVTEATYLLAFSPRAQQALLAFITAGALEVVEITAADISRAAVLMERFADLPMDFADATLVVLAERLGVFSVFTLDRRDFSVYRLGRRTFRIVPDAKTP